jgi:hypothetical protein
MSFGARVLLAVFALLFGVLMIAVAPPTDKAPLFYAFGAFCIAIAVACVTSGRIAAFFGSLVASGILVMGLQYFASMFLHGPLATGRPSDQSLMNAALFFGVFGLPSAIYLWRARFGLGFGARALRDPPPSAGRDNEV